MLDSLLRDLRSAVRMLAARPAWTTAAILCLAIATGANTAAFTLVDGLLLRPLRFDEPERLVTVALREPRLGPRPFALREYRDIAESSQPTIQLLARTFVPLSLVAEDGARMAQAELVSGNYFETLRVAPFLGRFFEAKDDRLGGEPQVVLSHRLWQLRFASDPAAIGRSVRANGRAAVVVGVAPPGFAGAMRLVAADLWLPAALYSDLAESAAAETVPLFGVMGRLADEVSADQAAARLTSIAAAVPRAGGAASAPAVIVTPATGFGVPVAAQGAVLTLSSFIYALMALLMAVACGNVAALVLALGAGRSREIAVRSSLGASRLQIARQLLVESLVLSLAGSAAGSIVAVWLTQTLVARLTTPFQYVSYAIDVQPDARVFAYSALAAGLSVLLCGIAPIRHAARVDVVEALKRSAAKGGSRESRRTLDAMVVMQFAVSTTLLAAAGMLVRGYLDAESARPGFDTRGVVAATLDLGQIRLDRAAGIRLFRDVMDRVSALPGAGEVSLTRDSPLGSGPATTVAADGGRAERVAAAATVVSPRYFQTLGVTVRQGRSFEDGEPALPATAIINEAMAERLWPAASPLGRVFRLNDAEAIEVIGVVPDLGVSPTRPAQPAFYRPFPQEYGARMTVLLRVRGDPRPFLEEVRRAIGEANRDLSIVDLRTVDDLLDVTLEQRRLPALALGLLGLLGLLLSAVGLYGVVSYGVRERARELGIRLALGARPIDVRRLVLRQGFGIVGRGLAVGLLGTVALAQALRTTLFGAGPLDPWIFAAVGVVLLLSSSAALYVPALWASRVEPAQTLRGE